MGDATHFVQVYETDEYLLSSLQGYVGASLSIGDCALVVATSAHREALEHLLVADGFDLPALIEVGQYIPLDAAEVLSQFMLDGAPHPNLFAQAVGELIERAKNGNRQVRVFGEMVALLWEEGNHDAAVRLEELWHDLQKQHSFTLFCAYPMRILTGESLMEMLDRVFDNHHYVLPAESYSMLPNADDRLRVIALLQQKARSLEQEILRRKEIEEELSHAIQQRDEFLSAVSHDLKTPLAVLQGHAQVLRRRVTRGALDEESLLKSLEQIEKRSRMMTELVDELLDVTRLRAGQELVLDCRPVDLVALARDVVAGQAEAAGSDRLTFSTTEGELIVTVDRARIRRVIENLLVNAVKYSPDGGEVTVTLSRESTPEGDRAVLAVQDQGLGIAEEDLPHVFERFYRGRNGSGSIGGSGLGLAGACQIVQQHGGTIEVASREGSGSTFTVRLPLG